MIVALEVIGIWFLIALALCIVVGKALKRRREEEYGPDDDY